VTFARVATQTDVFPSLFFGTPKWFRQAICRNAGAERERISWNALEKHHFESLPWAPSIPAHARKSVSCSTGFTVAKHPTSFVQAKHANPIV
jgi:hypothetical protein